MAFFKKKKEVKNPSEVAIPVCKFSQLFDRQKLEDLDTDDAELRFWLPEAGRVALDEVTEFLDVTEAFWLRATFLNFLYGEHEYRRMFAQRAEFFGPERFLSRKSESRSAMYSVSPTPEDNDTPRPIRRIEVIPALGKNLFPIKVYVPSQIKCDLQHAADDVKEPLSVFVRKLLLSRLLGHLAVSLPLPDYAFASVKRANDWAEFELQEQEIPVNEKADDDKTPEWF